MSIYLSIDLGTTGCRSILFNETLQPLAYAYEEYGLITPREGWVEQNAELWWELSLRTAASAIQKASLTGGEIDGISISSQGITVVPVDRDLKPLRTAMTWLDTRAEEETQELISIYGLDTLYRKSGRQASAALTLPKLLWLKKHEPEIFRSAWKFLTPMEFLVGKLTGNCITDPSMASGTMLYDLKTQNWDREILDRFEIGEDRLPTLASGGDFAGYVLPEVAKRLGLRADCRVAVGAQDQKCAALGAGLDEGVMTVSLGTAVAIEKRWSEAKTETNAGVCWCGYVLPDNFVTEGVINTAGTCLRWLRDMMFRGEDYRVIDEEADQALKRGSSLLFYPYLNGPAAPNYYPESEGCFHGVNLATVRGDFALAVMEGIVFQIRVLLETMEAYGSVHTLVLFGGGAKSDFWCRIIADATGMRIKVPSTTEAAGAGAAMLAAKACGKELSSLLCEKTYEPSERANDYEQKYQKFRAIEKRLWKQE